MDTKDPVLYEVLSGNGGDLGIITLNRPEVLNSLSITMVQSMQAQLKIWAEAQHIKAVVVRASAGRAFCAGGDIRAIYELARAQHPTVMDFFRDEYQLNRFIFHFPKPYIALLDGITMGGGVGISIHGSHRVATDNLVFAMPETGIGFYPDIGATYFLPRLPGYTGFYLGLTGARINSDDCLALGIAQHKVASDQLAKLVTALAETKFTENAIAAVTAIIETFKVASQPSTLLQHKHEIDACFSAETVEKIIYALASSSHPFCKNAAAVIHKKSPTSLVVTLRALQLGKQLDFDACMAQAFALTSRFVQEHDFIEGVRAVIIDKDQTPQWQPATLDQIKNNDEEKYFTS